jgi:hypothetical protein
MSPLTLDIRRLTACSRLSPGTCAQLSEAASVVLATSHASPPPPTPMTLSHNDTNRPAELLWSAPDAIQRSSHANHLEAIRDAACAVAIAAVHAVGYIVLRRPDHGSGADFVMTRIGDDTSDSIRLEVSGISRGHMPEIRARLAKKRAQLRRANDSPAIAIVVAFKSAMVRMENA